MCEGNLSVSAGCFMKNMGFEIWNKFITCIKGIVSHSNDSFYDMNQKILTKPAYFKNFSWCQFYVYKLWMINMCIYIAP